MSTCSPVWQHRGEFPALQAAVIAALEAAGFDSSVIMSAETFARLIVTDPEDGAQTPSRTRSAPCSAVHCHATSWTSTPRSPAAATHESNC